MTAALKSLTLMVMMLINIKANPYMLIDEVEGYGFKELIKLL